MLLTKKLMTELGRIVRFGMTGTTAALAYSVITFTITRTGASNIIVATIIGFFAAATISYFGHLYFSFRVEPDHRIFLWRFLLTALVTFAMTIGCTWLVTSVWGYPDRAAIAAVTILIPAVSYTCGRFWIFLPGLKK